MKNEVLKVSQNSVAQALAVDYFCIYYVNTDNDRFIEYSSSPQYRDFGLPTEGDDIIGFSRTNFEEIISPEDREMFLETFTKEKIVAAMDNEGAFTMNFRMLFPSGTAWVGLKATRMQDEEGNHVIIGLNNIDAQMRRQEEYLQSEEDRITYSRVAQALAGDYFSIYVVDPDTGHYSEYSMTSEFDRLGIGKSGEDFFNVSREVISQEIYSGDRDRFLRIFSKEKILAILDRDGSFTTKYRLMQGDEPVYVSMKATLLNDKDGKHMIMGTNNIDAQMKREEDYRQQMAAARTSARNDFLANMSHDIRTPMNAIVGYTNIAKQNSDDPEAVQNALDKIGSSSHFLLSLINDILDISKIESGKMQLSTNPCNLEEVLRRIEDITQLQAKNKSLKITYRHDGMRHYMVNADELRIEQVLINIISNAIKYTPEGKEVDLVAEEEALDTPGKNRYRFIIRDNGIGISEEYLPHLFESFTREENTKLNRVQGTGLGLAITAKVVEMMGGTIDVKSKVGEGSVFTVELDLDELVDNTASAETLVPEEDLAGCRILLVEDNEINAEIAEMILTQYGMVPERARNGQEGFEMVRTSGDGYYDAVLMDIQMPVMNGYESSRAIRALDGEYFRTLPIIAMSANAYDEDVRESLNSGMVGHIAKPYAPEALKALLAKHIHR